MVKKLLAGILSVSFILPVFLAKAAMTVTETVLSKDIAGNPVFTTGTRGEIIYGADPSVLVDDGTVYLYAGHDESNDSEVKRKIYNQKEYICYSTNNMKTWKPEGSIMKVNTSEVKWARDSSSGWASQVTKYREKYFLYMG